MSSSPAVRCSDCGFHWNSATMADGLRLLGACPKCGGALSFRDTALAPVPAPAPENAPSTGVAPHLVLGLPRRDGGL